MSYKLINGDCLKEMDKLIKDNIKVDLILTDPPYGTTNCKWDTIIPFKEMWSKLNRLSYDNTPIILFGSQPFSSQLILSNLDMFKYELIWDKIKGKQPLLSKVQPMKSHENIMVFCKKACTYNPQFRKDKPYKNKGGGKINSEHYKDKNLRKSKIDNKGSRFPVSVLRFKKTDYGVCHPTQKPIKMLEYLIRTYSNKNDTVLDFTMGSGSTGVACKRTNRNFIGIELDKDYYNIAVDRIENNIGDEKEKKN